MTCYWDPETGDVYDHEGTVVGTEDPVTFVGEWPRAVLDVLRDAMEGAKPSAYNQVLLADMASENIERGTPPEQV